LKSRAQFISACLFLAAEMTLLTLGAIHAFGSSLGWEFAPLVNEAAKLAVILTFPLVAIEWIVVLSLDPSESSDRADNHSKSELAKKERESRERFRLSDPVMKVRNVAAMTEVINDEMMRLPTEQRSMFAAILRRQYGDEFEGITLFLNDGHMPNVLDQPKAATPNTPLPAPSLTDKMKQMFGVQQSAAQTMAADSPATAAEPSGWKDLLGNAAQSGLERSGLLPQSDAAQQQATAQKDVAADRKAYQDAYYNHAADPKA